MLDTVCLYMQFLSHTLMPTSIRKLLHLFTSMDYPFMKKIILSLTLRGIAHNALHTVLLRALPLTPSILHSISRVLVFGSDLGSSTLSLMF